MRIGRLKKFIVLPLALALIGLAVLEALFIHGPERYVVKIAPQPAVIGLKTDTLTANFPAQLGWVGRVADQVTFRANTAGWRRFSSDSPRVGRRDILLEIPASQLMPGQNTVEMTLISLLGYQRNVRFGFDYGTQPVRLPLTRDWALGRPEVQDGYWQITDTGEGSQLHPVPGSEGYDRLVLASPPFAQGRRVSVDVTLVESTGNLWGFGVIPLWGGHNDPEDLSPRRGWEYAIAWYYSHQKGFGVEVSQKYGAAPHKTSKQYQKAEVKAGETYRLITEAWPVRDGQGGLRHHALRLKWAHPASGYESDWIEMTDVKTPLLDKPYAVALVAHRAQARFGQVMIEPLDK